nr:retrovirus-related Pol polyprotein from transposon TNT 1-94 [Tanacetum cinerariifolium]
MENFTNWKKRFICHILGIEPQFETIIKNGPFIPMIAGQRKPEGQWTGDETPLSTAFISTSIVQDFQNSHDDEEDKRSNHEYFNDLEEEYQARALLAKSKRFFKKGTQRFSSAKNKPELRPTKDFEAKNNKVKAKLVLLSSSASASKATTVKNKGLIAEAYKRDNEEVSSDDNEMVKVKILMTLAEENDVVSKEGAINGALVKISMRNRILGVDQLTKDPSSSGQKDIVFVKPSADDTKVSILGVERPWLSEAEVAVADSSATEYDLDNESSVCSTPLPLLKKLDGVEPNSGSKTIKPILRSKSTFKAKTLKGVKINEPSLAPAKGNKSSLALKVNSAPAEDIQCAGSDTRPPMLDRTDFASWQQRIRLYCHGKENEVNILKSIDEGPFQMGMFRETLAEGEEGALYLGPE